MTLPIPRFSDAELARFYARIDARQADECWPWTGYSDRHGRGRFSPRKGCNLMAPRVMWFLTRGDDPGSLHVCHSCDNPNCVNPSHLWLGTAKDNADDRADKGRGRAGAHKAHCKHGHPLTGDNVYVRRDTGHHQCRKCIRHRAERRAAIRKAMGLKRRDRFSVKDADQSLLSTPAFHAKWLCQHVKTAGWRVEL